MAAGTKTFTSFGLKSVYIATPPASAGAAVTWVAIPSVEQAGFKMSVSAVEQYGDDKYQATFLHSQKGQITVKGNKYSMTALDKLSANAAVVSAGSERMYFGTEIELRPPRVMVRAIAPIRNDDGTMDEMTLFWFNCDCQTIWDSGPQMERAKISELTMVFNTYPSTVDETGNAIPTSLGYAFGRFDVKV